MEAQTLWGRAAGCAGGERFADEMGVKDRPAYQSAISTSNRFLSIGKFDCAVPTNPFLPVLFYPVQDFNFSGLRGWIFRGIAKYEWCNEFVVFGYAHFSQ